MNSSVLRRLVSVTIASLTVVPLFAWFGMAAAQAAAPAAAADTSIPATPPAASAAAPDAASAAPESPDPRHHRHREWRGHRDRSGDDAHDNSLVTIGRDSALPQGQQAEEVVSIFGSSISDGDAGQVVSVVGDTRVTGDVSDSVVTILGNAYVDGKIGGDVVTVLGNIELGPHAEIDGDVVAVGGTLQRDPAAVIHGSVQNVIAGNFGSGGWLRTWIRQCLMYGRPLAWLPGLGWAWGVAFTCLALYAGLALLFRDGITRCVQTFETQPGQAVLAALIAMLLTPVLVVLLCMTVIGIPAVPFVVLALFCVSLFGKAVMLAWVGRRVTAGRSVGAMSHPAFAVLVGGVLALAVYTVPVLGFLVYKLLGFFGLGAVVYTLIVAARHRKTANGSVRGQAAAGVAAPPEPSGPAAAGRTAAQPITAALPRAGFWIRAAALLLDALLVGFFLAILDHRHFELLLLAAYGAVMWKLRGSTIGGLVFDLQIVRLDGRPVDWETAIIRALSCFLSLAVAGLGFIWIAFDDNKQAWHDKIAGTVVVRVAKGAPLV